MEIIAILKNYLIYLISIAAAMLILFFLYAFIKIILIEKIKFYYSLKLHKLTSGKRLQKLHFLKKRKLIKQLINSQDVEPNGNKGTGKTTINVLRSSLKQKNYMKYINKNKMYYEIMKPQEMKYIDYCKKNNNIPFLFANVELKNHFTGATAGDYNKSGKTGCAWYLITQQRPHFYPAFITITETADFLPKSLVYNDKKNPDTQFLPSLRDTFNKSRHLDYFFTFDSLAQKDYYKGIRSTSPTTIDMLYTKFYLPIHFKIVKQLKMQYNFLKNGIIAYYLYKLKNDYYLGKKYFIKKNEIKYHYKNFESFKTSLIVDKNKLFKNVKFNHKDFYKFESKHYKKEYAEKHKNAVKGS